MSYILEALRRAEAERERERGTVPGLHAQARHMPEHDDEPAAARSPAALTWVAVALAAVALVGAGWWFLAPKAEPPPVLAAAPVPAPVPAPVLPASPVVAAPAAPPAAAAPRTVPGPAAGGAAPPRAIPAPLRSAAAASSPVVVAAQRMPLRMDRATAPAPTASGLAATARTPPQAGPGAPSKSERLPRMAELPEALRRELPQMAIGGAINSPDPEARMVILNGQVRREGETIANGLVLTRIRAHAAVFEYKGQPFEMPF